MSSLLYLHGACAATWQVDEISKEYKVRFGWNEGRRLPEESKAVHLASEEALRQGKYGGTRNLGNRTGIVLGSAYGGLASYERFKASMVSPTGVQPLAFSFSLPSIPASVLSLYYGVTGAVTSLAECNDCGANAVHTAIGLLKGGVCDLVLTGSWYFPSDTAQQCGGGDRAWAAIAVIGTVAPEGMDYVTIDSNCDESTLPKQFDDEWFTGLNAVSLTKSPVLIRHNTGVLTLKRITHAG